MQLRTRAETNIKVYILNLNKFNQINDLLMINFHHSHVQSFLAYLASNSHLIIYKKKKKEHTSRTCSSPVDDGEESTTVEMARSCSGSWKKKKIKRTEMTLKRL